MQKYIKKILVCGSYDPRAICLGITTLIVSNNEIGHIIKKLNFLKILVFYQKELVKKFKIK